MRVAERYGGGGDVGGGVPRSVGGMAESLILDKKIVERRKNVKQTTAFENCWITFHFWTLYVVSV